MAKPNRTSAACVSRSVCVRELIRPDGRAAQWHDFQLFQLDLHEALAQNKSSAEQAVQPVRIEETAAFGQLLGDRLRSRLDGVHSDKICCAILPTADTIKHRCLGHLLSLNQVRGEREPIGVIGARIGEYTDPDVAIILWLPKLGDSCASSIAVTCSPS